jgi:hypothetical protein
VTYEALMTTMAEDAVDEERIPHRIEIDAVGPTIYMVRVYFEGEEEFDTKHVGLD